MKFVVLLLVGIFIGALGAVAGISAMRQGPPYHAVVMGVLGKQSQALRAMREAGQCPPADMARRLDVMRAIAGETDAAFLPVGDDDLFRQHSSAMQERLVAAVAAPPQDCDALGPVLASVGETCKGCHEDFR